MQTLKLAVLTVLILLHDAAFAVNYEVNKSTSMRDDQGGSFSVSSNGSLSDDLSLVSSNASFENFLFRESPRILVSGDLDAILSGTRSSYDYTMNGMMNVVVGNALHIVQFNDMRVSRRGLAVEIEGSLLVDGKEYPVRDGSLAEEMIVTIIILQGQ